MITEYITGVQAVFLPAAVKVLETGRIAFGPKYSTAISYSSDNQGQHDLPFTPESVASRNAMMSEP